MSRVGLNVAVSGAALLLSLAVAESYVRHERPGLLVAYNEHVAFCQYDAEIGWINRPSVRGRFFDTEVVHNKDGQRDTERRKGKVADEFRVMVMGDSFVWGYRVNVGDRFSDLLERSLPGIAMMNFGCSGYGTDQEYLLLGRLLPEYAPDLVLVAIHFGSDLENNVHSSQYGYYKPLFTLDGDELRLTHTPVPRAGFGKRINAWMTPRFALWNLLGNQELGGERLRARFVADVDGLTGADARAATSGVPPVDITCRLAKAIDDLARTAGAPALFMLIPNVNPVGQAIDEREEYATLHRCLDRLSLSVLDLEPEFSRYLSATPGAAVTLPGDRHWSAEGNRVVSDTLRGRLSAMRLHS